MWGVKRGLYANEAGQGTGAHPAAAAEVSHPAKQGLVQAFSIYLDVFLVVTSTAMMILFTNAYNVVDGSGKFLVQHLKGVDPGPGYTQHAIDTFIPGFGSGFVAIALFFFAFTTIFAYYYIAETNLAYLVRGKNRKMSMFILKIILLAAVFYGSVKTATTAWAMGDIGLGIMVWLNLLAILFLFKPALIALNDYEAQKKAGIEEPEFNSTKLGIKNADFWANGYQKSSNNKEKSSVNKDNNPSM
jgi:AGCS family alanine or glycine:cation symporter